MIRPDPRAGAPLEPIDDAADSDSSDGSRILRVLEGYLEELDGDLPRDPEDLLARYPDLAERLKPYLASLEFLHRAAASVRGAEEPPEALDGEEPRSALVDDARLLGDYRIIREIGRGGMGVVYEAEQVSLGRRVALKVLPFAAVLDPRQIQRFKNEAQAAAQLHHTNIVPVFSVGCERGVHYYAMQFIDGETLSSVIHELRRASGREAPAGGSRRPQTPDQARKPGMAAAGMSAPSGARRPSAGGPSFFRSIARLGCQAAEALEHAHRAGIVHRDVKPSNLLLDSGGIVWVTDFGLARFQGETGLTLSGAVLGTLRYMSPEQALAKRTVVDHRTDVYSLGTTLYELLTLEPVFDGRDREEILRKITFDEPRTPRRLQPAIPVELETIVLKALEKEPGARYATAQEFADDLRRYLDDHPIQARRPSLVQRARKWSRRHRTVVVAAALALAVAVLALGASTVLIYREGERTRAALERLTGEKRRADEEWKRAEENLEQSELAVETFLTRVAEDRLAKVPQMEKLRRDLLEDALGFYQKLLERNAANPRTRERAVQAHERMGQIRWKLGQPEAAEKEYREALAIIEKLREEFPKEAKFLWHAGFAHNELGGLLRDLGRIREAGEAWQEALGAREELAALMAKEVPQYDGELGMTLMNLAVLRIEHGEPEKGRDLLEKEAIPRLQAGARGAPAEPGHRTSLSMAWVNLGIACEALGDLDRAEESHRNAVENSAALASDHPDDPRVVERLAICRFGLASLTEARGRLVDAEKEYGEAAIIQKKLVADFPQVPRYHRDFGATLNNLQRFLYRRGELADARRVLELALKHQRTAVSLSPTDAQAREFLCNHLRNLASVFEKLDFRLESLKAYEELIEVSGKLLADHPGATRYRRALGSDYSLMGSLLVDIDRPGPAEEALRKALEIQEAEAEASPGDARYRTDVAGTLHELGRLFRDQQSLPEARAWAERALREDEEALKLAPASPEHRARVRDGHGFLAGILLGLGDHREATAHVEEALKLFPETCEDCFRMATLLARAVHLAENDESLPAAERDGIKRRYARRAAELLRRAALEGSPEARNVEMDADQDPIWRHPAFTENLKEKEP